MALLLSREDSLAPRSHGAGVPNVLTFSIDWLPDGRLLIIRPTESKLLQQERDGSLLMHKDLAPLSDRPWNEIVVD